MSEPNFSTRVNEQAEKAREVVLALLCIFPEVSNADFQEGGAFGEIRAELVAAERHLENARLRILHFAAQEAEG